MQACSFALDLVCRFTCDEVDNLVIRFTVTIEKPHMDWAERVTVHVTLVCLPAGRGVVGSCCG